MFNTPLRGTVFLVLRLLALPMMISNDSLWIDEGGTALFALQLSRDP